jgi:DNA repair photolyase
MIIRDIEVKSIMTKTNLPVSDFAVNPYVGCTHACKYCYASFMKRFTDHPEPWGEFVDVKHWPEINSPGKYAGKEAFFCSVTDPYHPPEKKYGRTRALLEQLLPTGISISISTKSDLILRDLELIGCSHKPHDTRHTCISMMTEKKVSPTLIKKIVDHSDAMSLTEKVYTHVNV